MVDGGSASPEAQASLTEVPAPLPLPGEPTVEAAAPQTTAESVSPDPVNISAPAEALGTTPGPTEATSGVGIQPRSTAAELSGGSKSASVAGEEHKTVLEKITGLFSRKPKAPEVSSTTPVQQVSETPGTTPPTPTTS